MKHLIELILQPSGLVALLMIAGGALFFIFQRRRAAGVVIAVAAFTYLVFAHGLVAFWLMSPLEHEAPPAQDAPTTASPEFVVVLTGYALADARRPITGQVNSASGFRLLEAARLFARRPLPVIISGSGEVPVLMRDLLVQLGVPDRNIVIEAESSNTYESAVHLRDRLEGKQFYLVTSAGHMPRSLGVFHKQGLTAIPAPTDYLAARSWRDIDIAPSARYLAISDLAMHEYLGLLWYRLLDRI